MLFKGCFLFYLLFQRFREIWLVGKGLALVSGSNGKLNLTFREEIKMKKAMVTMTITAITIMTWASIVLACGGGGGP